MRLGRPVILGMLFFGASVLTNGTSLERKAIAQEALSPYTTNVFLPDGSITEFVSIPGNPQEYFITSAADPQFGAIKAGATIPRGVFVARDNEPGIGKPSPAGPSGFADRPGCTPSGFNIGRSFISYNPDAYSGEGAYFIALDISAPGPLDLIFFTQPIAFDIDGDGSRVTQTEQIIPNSIPEAPTLGTDVYVIGLDLDFDSFSDVEFVISERRAVAIPFGSIAIDPPGSFACDGVSPGQCIGGVTVRRFVQFNDATGLFPDNPIIYMLLFLDSNNDGVVDHRDFGIDTDIELAIRNVKLLHDTVVTNAECCRFLLQADAFDDVAFCGGAEDRVFADLEFPVPDIETIKEARCVNEPESAFRHHVPAVPGSEVEFRISIQNHGNRDLAVSIDEETLSAMFPASVTFVPGSCVVQEEPPDLVDSFCPLFEEALNTPNGFPLEIGTFHPVDDCAVGPGDRFVFRFRVLLGPEEGDSAFCDEDIDVSNVISVSGRMLEPVDQILEPFGILGGDRDDEEEDCGSSMCCTSIPPCITGQVCHMGVCVILECVNNPCTPASNGIGDVADEFFIIVPDATDMIDTRREAAAGTDDNRVDIEIQCREIQLLKSVRLLPDGPFQTGLDRVDIPSAPARIEYRYAVTNGGEVDESATVRDPNLCDAVNGIPGASFVDCPLCTGPTPGNITGLIVAGGGPFVTSCVIEFATESALLAFSRADDNNPECRALNEFGDSDIFCYRNCADAISQAANLGETCPGPSIRAESFATVCHPICFVEVNKQVRCLDNCDDKNPVGDAKDALFVSPGSCVEYEIQVLNPAMTPEGGENLVPICRLQITDVLGDQGDCVEFDGSVKFSIDGVDCGDVPRDFNVNGAPFLWSPEVHCNGRRNLAPGETLTITFNATVPHDADPTCTPLNTVVVDAASDCRPGQLGFTCADEEDAELRVLDPSLTCLSKEWAFQWDSDAGCEPEAPFSDFAPTIHLEDKVFPVRLRLRVTAENTGNVPLNVTATDAMLSDCATMTPGVSILADPPCELDTFKNLLPDETAEWFCELRVETAEAMRALDACDQLIDGVYSNTATVIGTPKTGGTNICVPDEKLIPGDDDCSADIVVPEPCELDVTKQVKCADDPDAAYADDIDALPGSTLRYRVRVANTSDFTKMPRLCLTDVLSCRDWLVPNSIVCSIGGTNATGCVAPILNATLGSGSTGCFGLVPCRPAMPWLAPGETLSCTFDVLVPEDFGEVAGSPDCTNMITFEGFSEVCVPIPLPDEPCDEDSDNAQFDVLLPSLACEKMVRADVDDDGVFDTPFTTDLSLSCDEEGPFRLEYKFTITNTGETPLINVQICDEDLFDDALAAGLMLDPTCALADPGCTLAESLIPGASVMRTCTVRVPTRGAFEVFANGDGDGDADCYLNEAMATGDVNTAAICDFGAEAGVESELCSTRVCLRPQCELEVSKQVRCLDNCVDKNPIGPFVDELDVTVGACMEFVVNIKNDSDRVPVCRLSISDLLTGRPDDLLYQNNVTFRVGATACPVPPGFNVDGVPFEWDPTTCALPGLQPGETLGISFIASIPKGADPDVTPTNTVSVMGAADCPGGVPVYCCEGSANASVDILNPSLTCTRKEWAFQWDSDADCEPNPVTGPNAPFSDFAAEIDLRDKVFPVKLRLRLTALNDGEVPLDVVADDPALVGCIASTPGVSIMEPPDCEIGDSKLLMPGESADWFCEIRVETSDAMRALDTCDGATDNVYSNTAMVSGRLVSGPSGICVPENRVVEGTTDCSADIRVPPICDFAISKQVKCVNDPASAFADFAEALPGSRLTYRIQVANQSALVKIPRLCLTDALSCDEWLVAGSISATLNGTNVTSCFAPILEPALMNGSRQCYTLAACRPAAPWIAPGETLTIAFDVMVPTGFNEIGANPDCTNMVMVEGFAERCVPPPLEDRPCEMGMADATIDVLIPGLECEKKVCADLNNDGMCDTSSTNVLNVPCNITFPIGLIYEFTAINSGEAPLVNVRVCDAELINDAIAAGLTVNPCQLLPAPAGCSANSPLAVGASLTRSCRVVVPSRAAWENFAGRDADGQMDCYENLSQASATVDIATICESGANVNVTSEPCEATVCLAPICEMEVTKTVRCVNCANGAPIGSATASLPVTAGSCLEYEIKITNSSPDVSICRLRITDALSNQGANIQFANAVTFSVGQTSCPVPAGFSVNGAAFEWDPSTCGLSGLNPGEMLLIAFRASIPESADPNISPVNTVVVDGAPMCPAGGPTYCCQGMDDAVVDILRPSLTCQSKEWAFQWDSDADCEPNAPFSAFAPMIDLRDKLFPVKLRLKLTAQNTGEVSLNITVSDAALSACIASTPGVSLSQPPTCELGTSKLVAPGASSDWFCEIRVNTAEAMRALDACDGFVDGLYSNTASVSGMLTSGGTNTCVPENRVIAGTNSCSADIQVPPACEFNLAKRVTCINRCTNGTPTGAAMDVLETVPGSSARFSIEITNNNPFAKIPRICLTDTLTQAGWTCPGTVKATLAGVDITADFANFAADGVRRCYMFAGRPAAPWIAPGETLIVNFDVTVPGGFNSFGQNPDARNTVQIEAFAQKCAATPDVACDTGTDSADIDVRIPRLECMKTVAADVGNNGSIEVDPTTTISLSGTDYPIRLIYNLTARNTGELPITDVTLCDDELVAHARNAGISLLSCSLCNEPACSGGDDQCASAGGLAAGGQVSRACELVINDQAQWDAFAGSDSNDSQSTCYTNRMSARGNIAPACMPLGFDPVIESPDCQAQVCITATVEPCPVTKAKFDIWNQNEVRFSGTERCLISWDERLLSEYTPGGIANHFLRPALQTNKGRARIDGVSSPVVCGESKNLPLIGVAAKILNFGRTGVDLSGTTLVGSGSENGVIRYDLDDAPPPVTLRNESGGDKFTLVEAPGPVQVLHGGSDSKKGSLLIFPKVEIKWDAQNNLIQDTFVSLANDKEENVTVLMYFVNGDQPVPPVLSGNPPVEIERAHPGCNWVDVEINLTANEPTYWSAASGQPKGVSPFAILDPGFPPGRPDRDPRNPGGRVVRGYVIAWAVNEFRVETRWNHLQGSALVVNYLDQSAWEYSAWSFPAVYPVADGFGMALPYGQLDLNDMEYESAPNMLVFDFWASGSIFVNGNAGFFVDTDLTLWAVSKDLRDP